MISFVDTLREGKSLPVKERAELAKTIYNVYTRVRGGPYVKWRTKQEQARDFFHNDQLTKDEIKALEDAGMPTFTVNKITKGVETLQYFLTYKNPRFVFAARKGCSVDLAHVHNALAERCWNLSRGRSVLGQVVQDSLVESLGYLFQYVDPNADYGRGEIMFKHLDPLEGYPDPASRGLFMRDAAWFLIKQDRPKRDLVHRLPQYKSLIVKAEGLDEHTVSYSDRDTDDSTGILQDEIGVQTYTDEKLDQYIDYYEFYQKESLPYVRITLRKQPSQAEMKEVQTRVAAEMKIIRAKGEMAVEDKRIALTDAFKKGTISQERMAFEVKRVMKQFDEAMQQQQQRMMAMELRELTFVKSFSISKEEYEKVKKTYGKYITETSNYFETRISVVCAVGNQILYKLMLPISNFPMVPFPYLHTGTPYPIGNVQLVIGKQQEVNKSHQIMVHNASLGSSLRFKYKIGSINVEDAEKHITLPGGFVGITGELDNLQEIAPMPLSTAFLQITERGEHAIEESMGALPSMQGDVREQHETYKGLVAQDEFSTRRIRSWMTYVMEPGLVHVGEIFTEYARALYTQEKTIEIVDPDTDEREEHTLNAPLYDGFGKEVGKMYDYSTLDVDVSIVSGSTLPVNRWAERQEYKEYFEMGVIDDIAFLKKTDVKNKEAIIARKSMLAQAQQRIAALEESLKQAKGTIQTLERELIHASMKVETKAFAAELQKHISKFKEQQAIIEATLKTEREKLLYKAKVDFDALKDKEKDDKKPKKT